MNKLKRIMGTAGSSVVLAMGLAAPVGALQPAPSVSTDICTGNSCNDTDNTNRSRTYGPCTVFSYVSSDQSNATLQIGVGAAGLNTDEGDVRNVTGSNSNSNSTSQSVTVTNAPDCSTHNVTNNNVTQAAAPVQGGRGAGEAASAASAASSAAQVSAPKGGVGAGAGGATQSAATAIAGLTGSLGVMGLGLRARKGFEL
jgi:hypothetical protein